MESYCYWFCSSRQYRHRGKCPLVFIVSDSASGGALERKLFPKNLQEEVQIANIRYVL